MTAALVAVAKAVAAKIEHVEIHEAYELGRNYGDFNEKLEDLDRLHIDVIAETYPVSELDTRGSALYEVMVAVAVRKRFDVPDQTNEDEGKPRIKTDEVDALVGVVQNLFEFWLLEENRRIEDDEYSIAIMPEDSKIVIPCSRKALMQMHQFLGLIRLTFRASKELTDE